MRSKEFKLTFPLQKIRRFVSMALIAAIGAASGPTVALAQPAPVVASSAGATGLSLKEAAQLAILGNPEVLARWHTIKAAQGERDAARGALFPRVDLSLSKGRERGDVGTGSRSANSLSLTQLLFDLVARGETIEHRVRIRSCGAVRFALTQRKREQALSVEKKCGAHRISPCGKDASTVHPRRARLDRGSRGVAT